MTARLGAARFDAGDLLVVLGLAAVVAATVAPYLRGRRAARRETSVVSFLDRCAADAPAAFLAPAGVYAAAAARAGFELAPDTIRVRGRRREVLFASGDRFVSFSPAALALGRGIVLRARAARAPADAPDLCVLDAQRGLLDGRARPVPSTRAGDDGRRLTALGHALARLPFLPWLRARLSILEDAPPPAAGSFAGYRYRLGITTDEDGELRHVLLAWPARRGAAGFAAFAWIAGRGLVQTRNLVKRYEGAAAPRPGAPIRRPASELRPDGAYTGRDGNTWLPVLGPEND